MTPRPEGLVRLKNGDYDPNSMKHYKWVYDTFGLSQRDQSVASNNEQIGYEEYLRRGNERALKDWYRNVPNRTIRYPELSYSGQIHRGNTAISRLDYANDSAYSNYYGNFIYRSAGLYGITSHATRYI